MFLSKRLVGLVKGDTFTEPPNGGREATMNRLASVLAGAAVAAVSGAVIAAAAVGQGVFNGSPTKSTTVQDTAQVSNVATETTDATVEAATPQIVYVDKEPIYITRTVVQPVADSPAPTAQPTAT